MNQPSTWPKCLLFGLWLAACDQSAQGDGAPQFPSDYGGQTGSLLPPLDPNECGPLLGPDQVLTLSSANPGFVALGASLARGATQPDAGADAGSGSAVATWALADADGATVSLALEDNGSTAVLRPVSELTPGSYTLSYSCEGVVETAPVTVLAPAQPSAAAPKFVESVSLAYHPSAFSCRSVSQRVTLVLTLSAERATLSDATQLSLQGSGVDLVIAPYGSIDASSPTVELGVPLCGSVVAPSCLPPQTLKLDLVSEVLNEPEATTRLPLVIDAACIPEASQTPVEPTTVDDAAAQCSMRRASGSPGAWAWVAVALSGLFIRRAGARRRAAARPGRRACHG